MKRLITLFILTLLLGGCSQDRHMEKPILIKLTMGQSFKSLIESYPTLTIDKTPAEIDFYEMDWNPNHAGTIKLGDIAEFKETIYLNIVEDRRETEKGLAYINLYAGLTGEDWISHDEARLKFHEILQGLLAKGWKRSISYSEPRLPGKEAMQYKSNVEPYHYLDPAYLPTLQEWNALEHDGGMSSNFWTLQYHNKAFLKIKLGITDHKTDPNLGVYLMFIDIVNGENQARNNFRPEDKAKWKENWEAQKAEDAAIRAKEEIELKAQGYNIDENYQDYVINPEDY